MSTNQLEQMMQGTYEMLLDMVENFLGNQGQH